MSREDQAIAAEDDPDGREHYTGPPLAREGGFARVIPAKWFKPVAERLAAAYLLRRGG
jgi:hypothetical protein